MPRKTSADRREWSTGREAPGRFLFSACPFFCPVQSYSAETNRLGVAAISLMIGASGWYYLFYSRAAARLEVVESQPVNKRRVRLRRVNGVVMILLAVLLYAGTSSIEPHAHPLFSMAVLVGIIVLLGICVLLGWIDMRMTRRLHDRRRGDGDDSE